METRSTLLSHLSTFYTLFMCYHGNQVNPLISSQHTLHSVHVLPWEPGQPSYLISAHSTYSTAVFPWKLCQNVSQYVQYFSSIRSYQGWWRYGLIRFQVLIQADYLIRIIHTGCATPTPPTHHWRFPTWDPVQVDKWQDGFEAYQVTGHLHPTSTSSLYKLQSSWCHCRQMFPPNWTGLDFFPSCPQLCTPEFCVHSQVTLSMSPGRSGFR